MACAITGDLYFDMARRRQEALEQKSLGAESGFRLALRALDVGLQRSLIVDQPLTAPTAAPNGLQKSRKPNFSYRPCDLIGVGHDTMASGNDRHAGG